MKLLTNEEKILTSNAEKVALTNQRIQMTDTEWGRSYTISIFLEDISSIELKYSSNIVLLILGIITILAGLFISNSGNNGTALVVGLIVGGILIALWWSSRKHTVIISPDGGSKLRFIVEGMAEEVINDFVYNVQAAKLKRVNELFSARIPL